MRGSFEAVWRVIRTAGPASSGRACRRGAAHCGSPSLWPARGFGAAPPGGSPQESQPLSPVRSCYVTRCTNELATAHLIPVVNQMSRPQQRPQLVPVGSRGAAGLDPTARAEQSATWPLRPHLLCRLASEAECLFRRCRCLLFFCYFCVCGNGRFVNFTHEIISKRKESVSPASRSLLFDLSRPVTVEGADFPEERVSWLCDRPRRGVLQVAPTMPLKEIFSPFSESASKGWPCSTWEVLR